MFPDGKMTHYSCPDFTARGTYDLPRVPSEAVIDRRGMLYALCADDKPGPDEAAKGKGEANLYCFDVRDVLGGTGRPRALKPARVVPLGGRAEGLTLSPDHQWLYFLDTPGRRLGRVNLEAGKLDGALDGLSAGVRCFCLTPNGKSLFCCGTDGVLQELDAFQWKPLSTWKLSGSYRGVQATEGRVVLLNPAEGQWTHIKRFDAARGGDATDWAHVYLSNDIKLAPDQKRLYVSCFNLNPANVKSLWVPDPAKGRESGARSLDGNFGVRGRLTVSPDDRFLLCDAGYVILLRL
jgi:sugar lactone lactonase YvrE